MRGMSRTRMGLNWLDLLAFNLSAHNVLNMLNDCTKCWHLAFCNELPDVVTCFLA
ncbi:Uncharacterised protein [Enterobacter hormaechei]|nr:Uncharacterised protein [Enterobacter hormaechei]